MGSSRLILRAASVGRRCDGGSSNGLVIVVVAGLLFRGPCAVVG